MKKANNQPIKQIKRNQSALRCWRLHVALALILAGAGSALAGVRYVNVNSTNATPPYTNWATAATNILDAMDAALAGDEIVVTNGIYHRVRVERPLTVRSVNGPQFTTILGGSGQYPSFGCAYLTNDVSLSGFTLTKGGNGGQNQPTRSNEMSSQQDARL